MSCYVASLQHFKMAQCQFPTGCGLLSQRHAYGHEQPSSTLQRQLRQQPSHSLQRSTKKLQRSTKKLSHYARSPQLGQEFPP